MPAVNVDEKTQDNIEIIRETYEVDVTKRAVVDEAVEQFKQQRVNESNK